MTDQVRISDGGELEVERTWDGEPLWSTETTQEGLFTGNAFEQMPGQLAIEECRARGGVCDCICDCDSHCVRGMTS